MSDCSNIAIREQLPEFMHGFLDERSQLEVQAHLDGCADCAAELALLQAIRASGDVAVVAEQIDAIKIAASVPPYHAQRASGSGRMLRMAAAFLVAAAGVGTFAVSRHLSETGTARVDTLEVATGIDSQTNVRGSIPSGLGVVSVSALSNDQLEELIDEVPTLDALPSTYDAAQFLEFDPLAGLSVIEIGEI